MFLPTLKSFFRILAIALLNVLFFSKNAKTFFEKYIFNPYYGPSIDPAIIKAQYEALLNHANNLTGKVILEIGPGGDYSLACHFLRLGARKVYLIDTENHIHPSQEDIERYQKIHPSLITHKNTIDTSLLELLTYKQDGTIPLDQESIDIIFSNAVFEHVENPHLLVTETKRILKQTGLAFHQIDYRDHIASQTSLLLLLLPSRWYNIFFGRTGMWTNRFRHSFWFNEFIENGFMLKTFPQKSLLTNIPRSLKEQYSEEDLTTTSATFILRKNDVS